MKDLRDAIWTVLQDAASRGIFPNLTCGQDNNDWYTIDPELLKILQAEYNIHFVEPEAEQLEVIQ